MKQIKNILFLSVFLCIPIACIDIFDKNELRIFTPEDKKKISLPFNLQLSLDVIGLELEHYKDQFKEDWALDEHAQVIIEEAEILVQTAPPPLQSELKAQVIALFAKNNLTIEFSNQNTIIPKIEPIQLISLKKNDDTKKRHGKLPKKHKKKSHEAKQIFAPKKIHGARRTMKRLKKEAEEQRKREHEAIKARIIAKNKAILKAKRDAFLKEEALMRERIIKEQAREREESLHTMHVDHDPDLPEDHV